jgi:hypothetical protein
MGTFDEPGLPRRGSAAEWQRGVEDDDLPPPADHRGLGIALAAIATGALGFALLSHQWLASGNGELGFGLRSAIGCLPDGECSVTSNAEITHDALSTFSGYSVFPILGWVVSILSVVALVGLVAAAALAIARRRPELPISPTTLSLVGTMLGLIAGCVFVATKPGGAGVVGVSHGFFVFGGGVICGLIASIVLTRSIRPADVDLDADSMKADDF